MSTCRIYASIDLKSFYASVECIERGLDPMTAHLVVADPTRTEKTICLAVSPALKALGIPGRPRMFEVNQKINYVNAMRKMNAPYHRFTGKALDSNASKDTALEIDYIAAPPRMALYMTYSTRIYQLYLKYIAPEDIHVYSIDEVFIDLTGYLDIYKMTAHELVKTLIQEILRETGITATAGIGTNLYLSKIAMDIVAKHVTADRDGVRIAELDEQSYREKLWSHRPITDFWRIGKGYANKLAEHHLFTMGDIARCSIGQESDFYNEALLYQLFGVNAELLIDHAWGIEPCTIADIKSYKPSAKSMGSGQVLSCAYTSEKAKLVVMEMADQLALDLVEKGLVTDQLVLTVGYDISNVVEKKNSGITVVDRYGRKIPKHAHGTANLKRKTSSMGQITESFSELYDKIIDPNMTIRRIYVTANKVVQETQAKALTECTFEQMALFQDYKSIEKKAKEEEKKLEKERKIQESLIEIKYKFGKNAILKGRSYMDGATMKERNRQIGGHKA